MPPESECREIFEAWKGLCKEAWVLYKERRCEHCPLFYCYFCGPRCSVDRIDEFDIRVLMDTLDKYKAGVPVFKEEKA